MGIFERVICSVNVGAHARVCVFARVCARMRARARARVFARVCARMRARIHQGEYMRLIDIFGTDAAKYARTATQPGNKGNGSGSANGDGNGDDEASGVDAALTAGTMQVPIHGDAT